MLDQIEADYTIVNIREDAEALEFVRQRGHRTVPLLYYNEKQINVLNTNKYNTQSLQEAIDKAMWPSVDSGIEQGF
jgi:glutaredoxin